MHAECSMHGLRRTAQSTGFTHRASGCRAKLPHATLPSVKHESSYAVVVIGGGCAGVCAAIAAARLGASTALVHDRPLLGGSASGELGVHIAGADCSGSATARYVRESGIIDEIRLENLKRNTTGSAHMLSLIMREHVQTEADLDLYMNTRSLDVTLTSQSRIEAIAAYQLSTEKQYRFSGQLFVDCTGDGVVAAAAGARFRIGREARTEFDESLAPEIADDKTLPSSVEFFLKDMGRPVRFDAPAWAHTFATDADLPFRSTQADDWQFGGLYGGYWWLATGGDQSTIVDNEAIYEELLKVVMGIWDHMKNRGEHGAANFALHSVSPIPGKRESRRLEGLYWLTQNDVHAGRVFDDAVAYGGWPIDIHPPEGIYSKEPPNLAVPLARPYTIPLRCLFSSNVKNLFFAGRNASYTHVGLGSPRVMATCAVAGQAAGVAAALCAKHRQTPHSLHKHKTGEVQHELRTQGAYIPYLKYEDATMTTSARPAASSTAKLDLSGEPDPDSRTPVEQRLFQLLPLSTGELQRIEVLVDASRRVTLKAGIRRACDIWDFSSQTDLATAKAITNVGEQWTGFDFGGLDIDAGFYWMWLERESADTAAEGRSVYWLASERCPVGTVRGSFQPRECRVPELAPPYTTLRGSFLLRLQPESTPYAAENITGTGTRPERWTNLWISKPTGDQPEWVELRWDGPQRLRSVHLYFDGQFDTNLIWPPPLGVFGCGVLPSIVKRYEVTLRTDAGWKTVVEVDENYHYRRIHELGDIQASALRLYVYETNGVAEARVYGIRVY